MNNREADFKALMEKYQQELLQLQQQAVPVAAVTMPQQSSEVPAEPERQPAANTATATLQIRATAANQALPIPNAVVTISSETENNGEPLYVLLTDVSGLTESVTLPATDPALTQQPEDNIALITYDILITAPGYFSVRNSGVPLFGGIPTVQPVAMIPLPEFEEPNVTELDFTVPRNNL